MPVPRRLLVALLAVGAACGSSAAPAEFPDTTPAGEQSTRAAPSTTTAPTTTTVAAAAATPAAAPTGAGQVPEAAPPLNNAARVTTTAARDIEFDIDATCDIATAQALAARHRVCGSSCS